MIGGMMNKSTEMAQVPPHWAIYFRVPDINAATERIKANGGTILNGPMEVPGGDWIVNAMDPQGGSFACTPGRRSSTAAGRPWFGSPGSGCSALPALRALKNRRSAGL